MTPMPHPYRKCTCGVPGTGDCWVHDGDNAEDSVSETPMPKARKPTIYEALRDKLGREPTHAELCADVRRILKGQP
jgi:hypothetical protein